MIAAVSETFILRLARMAELAATASLHAEAALAQSCALYRATSAGGRLNKGAVYKLSR